MIKLLLAGKQIKPFHNPQVKHSVNPIHSILGFKWALNHHKLLSMKETTQNPVHKLFWMNKK